MSARDTVVASREVPAPPRQPRFSLKAPRDPGLAALRRAARAAIVIPLAFALGTFLLHLGQNVIFIVFGCFALLVITDFGGLRPARARAYLTATAVGAVLVALGTFGSLTIAAGAAVPFVVALVISFARVFGGYFVAGQTGMLLAYIVATAVPAPSSSIPTRVGAFALAGVISTLAGVFMWPRFERVTLCKQAAKACLRMADLVEALNARGGAAELQRRIDAARAAEQAGRPADQVLDGLDVDHTLRVIAYLTIALGGNAIITAGGRPEVNVPRSASTRAGLGGVTLRVLGTIRTHLDSSSTVVQSSLRVAI